MPPSPSPPYSSVITAQSISSKSNVEESPMSVESLTVSDDPVKGRRSERRAKVRFGSLKVREYNVTISDNPCVCGGPPIGLGWRGKDVFECLIDVYETKRQTRRTGRELVIPRTMREEILIYSGHARKEIAESVREVIKIRNQRVQTINNLGLAGFEEKIESARKLFFGSCLTKKVGEPSLYSLTDFEH